MARAKTPRTPAAATAEEPAQKPDEFTITVPPEVQALLAQNGEDTGGLVEEGEVPPQPEPAPAEPARTPGQPPAEPEPPPKAVMSAAHASRAKRAEALWEQIEREVEAARIRTATLPPEAGGLTDQQWATFLAQARAEIDQAKADMAEMAKADDFEAASKAASQALGRVGEAIFARLRDYDRQRTEAERTVRWRASMAALENAARARYPDFDWVMQESDTWAGVPDPQTLAIRNPALAQRIYAEPDPPDTAYWIGVNVLARRGGVSVEEWLARRAASQTDAPAAPPAATPAPAATPTPAAPTRPTAVATVPGAPARIAQEFEQAAAPRPRGLRGLSRAGEAPPRLFSRAQLDNLRVVNPMAWNALLESMNASNPDAYRRYMMGEGEFVA